MFRFGHHTALHTAGSRLTYITVAVIIVALVIAVYTWEKNK